jgi:hypothetical protein
VNGVPVIALKAAIVVLGTVVLATVNTYLIEAYWGELVCTAVVTGAMAYGLGRVGDRS